MLFSKSLLALLSFTMMCTTAMGQDPHETTILSLGYQQAKVKTMEISTG